MGRFLLCSHSKKCKVPGGKVKSRATSSSVNVQYARLLLSGDQLYGKMRAAVAMGSSVASGTAVVTRVGSGVTAIAVADAGKGDGVTVISSVGSLITVRATGVVATILGAGVSISSASRSPDVQLTRNNVIVTHAKNTIPKLSLILFIL